MITNVEVFDRQARRRPHGPLELPDQRIPRRTARASLPAGAATASSSTDGRWLIAVRQVNLIDCDQNLRNPSIVI